MLAIPKLGRQKQEDAVTYWTLSQDNLLDSIQASEGLLCCKRLLIRSQL